MPSSTTIHTGKSEVQFAPCIALFKGRHIIVFQCTVEVSHNESNLHPGETTYDIDIEGFTEMEMFEAGTQAGSLVLAYRNRKTMFGAAVLQDYMFDYGASGDIHMSMNFTSLHREDYE